MAVCYRHPSRETNVSCSNCGRPICPDCMTVTPVGMRCPECASERTQVRARRRGCGPAGPGDLCVDRDQRRRLRRRDARGGAGALRAGGKVINDGGLYGPAVANGDWWRIVTAGFLHAGTDPHRASTCTSCSSSAPCSSPAIGTPAVPGRLLRLPARRLVRRPAAEPERDHGGRLGGDLRPHVGRLHRRPPPRASSSSPARSRSSSPSTCSSPSACPGSASAATSAAWSAGRWPGS